MTASLSFRENVLLKDFCTLEIGGPAKQFLEVRTIEEMQQAIDHCYKSHLPFLVIGKGSNCLFDDRGFDGVVLLNKIDFFNEDLPGTFHVGAGYSFALLGVQTARKGWGGLEFASGIPATVGGAIFMNAGANGSETCQYLVSIDYIDEKGILKKISRDEITFHYRFSSFQEKKGAIVGATFKLYANSEARKQQIAIVNHRTKTQPYGDKSAGCIFVNPQAGHAGALIDQCGLKGLTVDGAAVSNLHANFLINSQHATCKSMLKLISVVKDAVKEKTGIELQSEVRCIPFQMEDK